MGDVGNLLNFVDTQQFKLTNVTDALTYIQLTDVILDLDSNVTKHQLTDDTIDNVFSLYMSGVQGNIWVTNPEWPALVVLTIDVAGVRPVKSWNLIQMDQSNTLKTTTFNAQLKTLKEIDRGIGAVQLFFRLELTEAVVVT